MSGWIIWFGEVVFFLIISIWGFYLVLHGRTRRHTGPSWHRVTPPPSDLTDQPQDERTW